jgi:hypothetical protein
LLFQNIMQLDILVFLFIFLEKRKLNGTATFRFITTTIQNIKFNIHHFFTRCAIKIFTLTLKSKMTSGYSFSSGGWRAVRRAYFALLFQNIMQLDILVFLFIFHEKENLMAQRYSFLLLQQFKIQHSSILYSLCH